MLVSRTIPAGGLGALPGIIVAIMTTAAKYEWNEAQLARALGEQFEEMQRLSEAQITELAIILGDNTDKPAWKWFTILRDAREIGLLQPGNGNGTPPPPPPPTDNKTLWIALGAGALILLGAFRK